MTTVGALIDRTFRSFLEPPNAQPATSRLASGMLIDAESLTLVTFDVPEDENLMRIGSLIEVGQELMRVTNYDASTKDAQVLRGQLRTEPAAHNADDIVKLYAPYARKDVFDAVVQNIIGLYPDLFTVRTENLLPVGGNIYPVTDPLIVELIDARYELDQGFSNTNLHGKIIDYHELARGRALILNHAAGGIYARFRRRFGVATSEDTTLESLGLEPVWENIVVVGAAADMLAGRDIEQSHADWVGSTLEAEVVPVGAKTQLAQNLARYRELLVGRFSQEMQGEDGYGIQTQMANPFTQVY